MSARGGGRGVVALVALLAAVAGCATTTPLDTEVALARHGEDVLASMDDLEGARVASIARLARLEELVRAAPSRGDVRRMLVVGWARYGLLFVEDDVDEARERGDGPTAGYHAMRARNAYERALHHGRELLGPAGFDVAASNDTMGGWLAGRVGDDAELLAWMGAAWLGRIRVSPEERKQLVLQAHVGEALLERSVALDPKAANGWAHVLLGLWRGRAGGDLDRARQHFDRAFEVSGHKLLLASVYLARTVVCQTHERERWDALFKEVLDARDPAAELRIDNAVAKRKASRDLAGTRRAQCVP